MQPIFNPYSTHYSDFNTTAYYLPEWCPASKYVQLFKDLGLEDVRQDDWSEYIAPFWGAVFQSALPPKNFIRLLRSGMTTVKGAIATVSWTWSWNTSRSWSTLCYPIDIWWASRLCYASTVKIFCWCCCERERETDWLMLIGIACLCVVIFVHLILSFFPS